MFLKQKTLICTKKTTLVSCTTTSSCRNLSTLKLKIYRKKSITCHSSNRNKANFRRSFQLKYVYHLDLCRTEYQSHTPAEKKTSTKSRAVAYKTKLTWLT